MELLKKYFPAFTALQLEQFAKAAAAYKEWNDKINVVSRKDIENLEENHFLHSLGIAKAVQLPAGTSLIDVGTGGGFPGIPLAIAFPESKFLLVDSIGKKLKVAEAVINAAGLENVRTQHDRIENITAVCNYVTGRAVETIPEFYNRVKHLLKAESNGPLRNGILYLKGGDYSAELEGFKRTIEEFPLASFFDEPFFETKKLLYLPA